MQHGLPGRLATGLVVVSEGVDVNLEVRVDLNHATPADLEQGDERWTEFAVFKLAVSEAIAPARL